MASVQELLEQARVEAQLQMQAELREWNTKYPEAAAELKKLWAKNLVVGHKALGRELLDKAAAKGKDD